jgi:hypothetical protein
MDVAYANTTGVPPSLSGSKYYVADEVHFSSQDCNVTADTLLKVCCKVKFKEGFDFDGDICDLDGDAIFQGFGATDGYSLLASTASCDDKGSSDQALVGIADAGETEKGKGTSTKLQCYTTDIGGGSVEVRNPARVTAPDNDGIVINGGSVANCGDIKITTNVQGGTLNLISSGDMGLSSFADINVHAAGDLNISNVLLNMKLGVYIADHPRYFGFGSEGNRGDKRGDIRINVKPATTTNPTMVGSLYVCIEDYENVSPPTDRAIWGRVDLNSW